MRRPENPQRERHVSIERSRPFHCADPQTIERDHLPGVSGDEYVPRRCWFSVECGAVTEQAKEEAAAHCLDRCFLSIILLSTKTLTDKILSCQFHQ